VVLGLVTKLAKLEYQLVPGLVERGLARFIEGYLRRRACAAHAGRHLAADG
jgi:hypothetical protein